MNIKNSHKENSSEENSAPLQVSGAPAQFDLFQPLETYTPRRESVQAQLRHVDDVLTITDNDRWGNTFKFSPKQPATWSPEEQAQYQQETAEDIDSLELKLERLKIKMLTYYLEGTYPYSPGLSYEEGNKTIGGQFCDLTAKLFYQETPITETQRKKLLQETNKRIPREFALPHSSHLSKEDAEILYELAQKMHYGSPPDKTEKQRLEVLMIKILEIEKGILEIKNQGELFPQQGEAFWMDQKMREYANKY